MTDQSVKMEEKRKIILKVAEKILSQRGFSKTSIEDITKKVKIGKGTFYIYFKNKKELFFSIIKENIDNLFLEMKRETIGISDFFEKIKKFIEIYLAYHEKNYYIFKILLQEKPFLKEKSFENIWNTFYGKFDFIKKEIKNGIKKNDIKGLDVDDIIFSLIGILNSAVHKWLLDGRNYSLKAKKDVIFEIFINGIRR